MKKIKTTCPSCFAEVDHSVHRFSTAQPQPEDLHVCSKCLKPAKYSKSMELLFLDVEKLLPSEAEEIQQVIDHIKELKGTIE